MHVSCWAKKTTTTATSTTERTFYLKQCSYLDQSSCLELNMWVWSRARVTAFLWIGARVGCRAGAWSSCVWYRAGAWNSCLERSSFLEQSGPCWGRVRVWVEERWCLQRSWLAGQYIVCFTECDSRDFIISELLLLVFFSSWHKKFHYHGGALIWYHEVDSKNYQTV